jgi:hypothetical protein
VSAGSRRWWTVRRAQSSRPATYKCPFCGGLLHAMSEHMLIAPEGDVGRRRHAHTQCVAAAHASGRLPTYYDFSSSEGGRGWRGLRRLGRRSS